MDSIEPMLRRIGFRDIQMDLREESRDFIKLLMPNSGCEKYIIAANITAMKPKVSELNSPTTRALPSGITVCLLLLAISLLIVIDLTSASPNYVTCIFGTSGVGWLLWKTWQEQHQLAKQWKLKKSVAKSTVNASQKPAAGG